MKLFVWDFHGVLEKGVVIIGDSPSDIALQEVAESTTYLYCHPNRKFKDCNSTYKINDLREILKEI